MQAGWGGPKDATEERTQQEGRAATLAAGGMREDSRGAVRGFAGGRARLCGRLREDLREAVGGIAPRFARLRVGVHVKNPLNACKLRYEFVPLPPREV